MPIIFNAKTDEWIIEKATKEEKSSLIELGLKVLVTEMARAGVMDMFESGDLKIKDMYMVEEEDEMQKELTKRSQEITEEFFNDLKASKKKPKH